MIQAGVGQSKNADSFKAGADAINQALGELKAQKPDLIIAFASVAFDQKQILDGIHSIAPGVPLAGCSSSGEITTQQGPASQSVAVMAFKSEDVKFTIGIGRNIKADSRKAGKDAAQDVVKKTKDKISVFIMLPDGLTGNGAEIVRGVQDVLGSKFPIMGGSAGDDFKFEKTFQYYNDQVFSDSVVGIGLAGKISFGVGVKHGWEPIGLPMKVTKSSGAVLQELDNKPALNIYQDYFGKKADELIREPLAKMAYTYPLGMSIKGSEELLIRDVVIGNKKGEITCAAEIPQGSKIRLMLGDIKKAIKAATIAAENAKQELKNAKPSAVLIFNCIARSKLLGAKRNLEIKAIQKVLGENTPLIGFYTYGEQAPINNKTVFHNETMTLLALN